MSEPKLDEVFRQIQEASKIIAPFDYTFYGEKSDANLFARIVRGELPQRRIWESKHHVAFLTPFPNTTGMTFCSIDFQPRIVHEVLGSSDSFASYSCRQKH